MKKEQESIIHSTFIKHLVCAKRCPRPWGQCSELEGLGSCFPRAHTGVGERWTTDTPASENSGPQEGWRKAG